MTRAGRPSRRSRDSASATRENRARPALFRELEQFDFLELVLADDAAGVAPGGAGFGAEQDVQAQVVAERIGVQGFVAKQAADALPPSEITKIGAFDRRNMSAANLGSWPTPVKERVIDQHGRLVLGVAADGVRLEEAGQARSRRAPRPRVHGQARAGNFRGAGQIETLAASPIFSSAVSGEIQFAGAPGRHLDVGGCPAAW